MCTETSKSNYSCCEYIKDDLKWEMNIFYYPKDNNGKDIIFEFKDGKGALRCPLLTTKNLKTIPRIGENIKSGGALYKVLNVTYDYDNGAVNVETQWIEPADNGCDECDFEHCWKNDEKFKKFKKNNFECLPKDFFSLPRKAQDMILEDVDGNKDKE